MNIGPIHIDPPTVMAPLAGITNLPFRLMAKAAGCGLVCSEMVSANGLVRRTRKTLVLMDSVPAERPLSVQIFGADPQVMAEAAGMVEAAGADILDINFGCSVRKVVRTGAGAALMRDPKRSQALLAAVRRAVKIPLTIKIRTGWDPSGTQALDIAEIAAAEGVDAVTVHPRTATQGFGGRADWGLIRQVRRRISVPVIGNGDIVDPQDALDMMAATGCAAVMIGRAAIGRPYLFSQVHALLEGRPPPEINADRQLDSLEEYARQTVRYVGETHGCRMLRSRLGWFVKGLPHAARFRETIKQLASLEQTLEVTSAYRRQLERRPG